MISGKAIRKKDIKKLVAISFIVAIVLEILMTVIVTEEFLNIDKFIRYDMSGNVVIRELSGAEQAAWLEQKLETQVLGEAGECQVLPNTVTSHSHIIILHSLSTVQKDMAVYAVHFNELGFNVYIPDYIDGTFTLGINEAQYLQTLVQEIVKSDPEGKIFIFGLGAGGTTALSASDMELPGNVKGIISDSAFHDFNEIVRLNINEMYHVPTYPVAQLSSLYTKLTRGWSFSDTGALQAVRHTQLPILYIHSTEDSIVPVGQSNRLFEVTHSEGTDHVTIYGATHCTGVVTDSEKYWREVDAFIRNSLD
ncbi:MAG: hypothetical protein IIX14_00955 [Clostridia bacterium]|nr:hypothetical protein [Clostridia bacterium]